MAKNDDKRADEALRALLAPREQPVRELAAALAAIEDVDAQLDALVRRREEVLVAAAATAFDAAKASGWKAQELSGAGLSVPRPYSLPTRRQTKTNGTEAETQTPRPLGDDPS